ncbi:hypothetical protein ACIRRA_42380 [Nocardia sp. NPDC101769]|uniref:hypothetical protein n=1 Tax=Nocardia sp. NPDC101769 TaxID=3364333 RepID=UPI00381E1395
MALSAVRDLREFRAPATDDEIAVFELDVLSTNVSNRPSSDRPRNGVDRSRTHRESAPDDANQRELAVKCLQFG